MSLIPCTCACRYQKDGCCTLERAVTGSLAMWSGPDQCPNYVPSAVSDQNGQCLPDIAHRDQRESIRSGQFAAAAGRDETLGEAQPPDLG